MSKKKRPSTHGIKQLMFQKYGKICMVCERRFDTKYLQYHHIVEFSHGGATNEENGGIVCPTCHQMIHRDKKLYKEYNNKIRAFKSTHNK